MSAIPRATQTSAMAAESARSLTARDESAELTAEQEEAEYETFTRMETERILREEVCALCLRRYGMPISA